MNICKLSFFHLIIWVLFPYVHLTAQIFILNNLFVCLYSCDFYIYYFFLSILMVIISLELTRVNPDRNIFSINVELTSTFLLYRGLVHHHHWILNLPEPWWILYIPYKVTTRGLVRTATYISSSSITSAYSLNTISVIIPRKLSIKRILSFFIRFVTGRVRTTFQVQG